MSGEAVDQAIRKYMSEHGVSYVEAFNSVVYAEDPGDVVRDYQTGCTSGSDLLTQLRAGLDQLEGMAGSLVAARLAEEGRRLAEVLENARDRRCALLEETGTAVDALLSAIADERQRRERERPRVVGQTELGGMVYTEPAADRSDAGARLDALARTYMAEHGGSYAAAFDVVRRERPDLLRVYTQLDA